MRFRPLLLLALAASALVLAGCGNKVEVRTVAETEGIYIDVGELKYQVQLSRILNPNDEEDEAYLQGLPAGTEPLGADEAWFGVWIRVENTTDELTLMSADEFEIVDTQEHTFKPIPLADDEPVRLRAAGAEAADRGAQLRLAGGPGPDPGLADPLQGHDRGAREPPARVQDHRARRCPTTSASSTSTSS